MRYGYTKTAQELKIKLIFNRLIFNLLPNMYNQ